MLKLVMCEDDLEQQIWLEAVLNEWAQTKGEKLELKKYASAESLLFDKEGWIDSDGLLLDIELKAMNGMALAKTIREEDCYLPIVFLTGFEGFVFEGYEVGALSYLLKPIDLNKLHRVLDQMLRQRQVVREVLILDCKEGRERVYLSDILYVESQGHNTIVRSEKSEHRCLEGISTVFEQLEGKGFIMPHRSFVVNIDKVSRVNKKTIGLDGGFEVPIARGKWAYVNECTLNRFAKNDITG